MAKRMNLEDRITEKEMIMAIVRSFNSTLDSYEHDVAFDYTEIDEEEELKNWRTGELEMRKKWDYVKKSELSHEDEIKMLAIDRIRELIETLI